MLFSFHTDVENLIFHKKKYEYKDKALLSNSRSSTLGSGQNAFSSMTSKLIWNCDLLQHHLKLYFQGID